MTTVVPIEIVAAPTAGGEAIGVTVLTGEDEPIALATESATTTPRARGRASEPEGVTDRWPADAPTTTGMLAMRGLRHDLSVTPEIAAKLFANDKPYVPETTRPDRFKPNNRDQVLKDSVMTTTVHADGSVDFKDQKDFQIHFNLPIPRLRVLKQIVKAMGEGVDEWADDPYAERTRIGRTQDLSREMLAIPGACQTWGDPGCKADQQDRVHTTEDGEALIKPLIDGRADITSWLHRKYVGDPNASRKLAFLDSTRDERVRRGTKYRADQLEQSADIMRKNLEQLWRATSDAAERRDALFALWDECNEGEGERGEAGERARAMVIGWIGSHLPKGQPGAFTDEQIASYDARRSSRQHFAPYAAAE